MAPTLGQQVLYIATDDDIQVMKKIDNCNEQDVLPATIVAVWGDTSEAAVNVKVHLDGEGELWVTSISQGEDQGNWKLPPSQ